MAAFGLQLWLQSQPPGTLVSGTITVHCSESSVSLLSAASVASGSSTSSRRCLGAYGTITSPGLKRRLANTPRPAMLCSRNSTGARLNLGLCGLGMGRLDLELGHVASRSGLCCGRDARARSEVRTLHDRDPARTGGHGARIPCTGRAPR